MRYSIEEAIQVVEERLSELSATAVSKDAGNIIEIRFPSTSSVTKSPICTGLIRSQWSKKKRLDDVLNTIRFHFGLK